MLRIRETPCSRALRITSSRSSSNCSSFRWAWLSNSMPQILLPPSSYKQLKPVQGIENDFRPSHHLIDVDHPDLPAVPAVIAVVPQDEQVAGRHPRGRVVSPDFAAYVRFLQFFPVPPHITVANGDFIARKADHPLDEIPVLLRVKHDDIAVGRKSLTVDPFVHDQQLIPLQGGKHGAAVHPVGSVK